GGADIDGDGMVSMAELYTYAYRRTLLRTSAGTTLQHPELAVNLAGSGDLRLTRPSSAPASVEVPGRAERYLVFALPGGALMGEISTTGNLRLALPRGRFLVVRRTADQARAALVDLSTGGSVRLGETDFRPVGREELIARGGRLELRPWQIDA